MSKATEELMKKKPVRGSKMLSHVNGKVVKNPRPSPYPGTVIGTRG